MHDRRNLTSLTTLLVPAAGALALAACSFDPADEVATHANPIIGGEPADARHAAVVGLHAESFGSFSDSPFCSGTLIAEDVVLTAAHCLDTANGGPNFKTRSPGSLAIYVGDDPSADFAGNHYTVSETRIHPDYDRRRLHNDIALVRLSSPLAGAATTAPLPAADGFTSADVDTLTLDFAGFGYSDLAKTEFGVKLHIEGTLGGLGCSVSGCPSGQPTATQISYAQAGSGPCNGDSGGPAFLDRGGVQYVGGVTSYGDAYCDTYGASTRVDAFEGWIAAFVGGGGDPGPDCSDDGVCNGDCSDDPDCGGDPTCELGLPSGASCSSDGECCSGKCRGRPGGETCR